MQAAKEIEANSDVFLLMIVEPLLRWPWPSEPVDLDAAGGIAALAVGEAVRGRVHLSVDRQRKCVRRRLKVRGRGQCGWPDRAGAQSAWRWAGLKAIGQEEPGAVAAV